MARLRGSVRCCAVGQLMAGHQSVTSHPNPVVKENLNVRALEDPSIRKTSLIADRISTNRWVVLVADEGPAGTLVASWSAHSPLTWASCWHPAGRRGRAGS